MGFLKSGVQTLFGRACGTCGDKLHSTAGGRARFRKNDDAPQMLAKVTVLLSTVVQ